MLQIEIIKFEAQDVITASTVNPEVEIDPGQEPNLPC